MFSEILTPCLYAGTSAGALCLVVGLLAWQLPFFELANDCRPFALAGTGVLLAISITIGDRRLMMIDAVVFAATLLLFLLPFTLATRKKKDETRLIRLMTFNMEHTNTRKHDICAFIADADPDIVLIQEIDAAGAAELARGLEPSYVHMSHVGQSRKVGLALFSRLPCVDSGTVERNEHKPGVVSAHVRQQAANYDVMNVYLADPFHPMEQARQIDWLIGHIRAWDRPLIIAGDFNLTPFSAKLTKFALATGLKRHGTLLASWPADKFHPMFLIDNVFASPEFGSANVSVGPFLGSDHRPIIADITIGSRGPNTSESRDGKSPSQSPKRDPRGVIAPRKLFLDVENVALAGGHRWEASSRRQKA